MAVQSAERLSPQALRSLRSRAGLIVSYHDWQATRRLPEVLARLRRIPADLYKAVFMARTLEDNVRVLRFLDEAAAELPLVAFCMGEAGGTSRILCLRSGSAFTFAASGAGEETAPGQMEAAILRRLYRVEDLNRATRVFGVLGYPLAHSLSPLMLNAAFRRASVNAVYLPILTRRAEEALALIEGLPIQGLSITRPHKTALLAAMDGIDPLARKVGAINTVVRSGGKLYGYNTDIAGILGPLEAAQVKLSGARALVLGAGGAARAAVFALRTRGARVFVCNRTRTRAVSLAKQARAQTIARRELRKTDFDVLIQATPVGQTPHAEQSPLEEEEIRAAVVFDLVYNPLETELLRRASARGSRTISGLEMFVTQGARQFEIWTGKPAPREEMLREVLSELQP